MSPRSPLHVRRFLTALAVAGVVAIGVSACGAAATSPATGPTPTPAADNGMGGMSGMATGNGLTGDSSGFTFTAVTSELPATKAASFRFQIQAADGTPVTAFALDQTKLMHFYLVRSDLTGFQHVHPTMAGDGTWTAPLGAAQPGSYRASASFIVKNPAGDPVPLVLSRPLTVPGTSAKPTPLPAAAASAQVDGYTLKLDITQVMAGQGR